MPPTRKKNIAGYASVGQLFDGMGVPWGPNMEVFGGFGGLQGSQNRFEERLESAGEAVSPPSGPKEGPSGAQGAQSGGVGALKVATREPGRTQKGAQESQERR